MTDEGRKLNDPRPAVPERGASHGRRLNVRAIPVDREVDVSGIPCSILMMERSSRGEETDGPATCT